MQLYEETTMALETLGMVSERKVAGWPI